VVGSVCTTHHTLAIHNRMGAVHVQVPCLTPLLPSLAATCLRFMFDQPVLHTTQVLGAPGCVQGPHISSRWLHGGGVRCVICVPIHRQA
jgi:hypothetical protein